MSKRHNVNHLYRSCAMAGLLACLGALSACGSDDKPAPAGGGDMVLGTATRIDPGANKYFSLEGPYWVAADGGYLLFSDVVEKNGAEIKVGDPEPKIHKYVPSTNTFSVYPYPAMALTSTNGLGTDSMGRLLATERVNARVVRVEGTMLNPIATTFNMMPLNAPNDLVVGVNDNIYFSDTLWGSKKDAATLAMQPNSCYRRAPDGTLTRIHMASSVNGVALSPDKKTLYIGNDMTGEIMKQALGDDGAPMGAPVEFAKKSSVPGDKLLVPDGINVDDDGNVYIALNDFGVNAIAKFKPDGTYLGKYMVPVTLDAGKNPMTDTAGNGPSNVSFGGPDRKTMYITTHHAIWKMDVSTPGKP